MKSINTKNIGLAAFAACLLVVQTVQAESLAKNRNDVYGALSQLSSDITVSGLDVWINEKSAAPVVNIGDSIVFNMKSDTPAFYTLIYVDSKGGTSILKPMGVKDTFDSASNRLVYPSGDHGDIQFTQAEPIGQDSIYLLASKRAIASEVLGLGANENYRDLGKNMLEIENLVAQINNHAKSNPLSVMRYTYAVESAETQYSTRSIKRKVNDLENTASTSTDSLNFNNINFAFKSDELTGPGRLELDGLGNALVSMQEKNGQFPVVELIGHTDAIGSEEYNENLSSLRAESAKKYLVSEHGVPFDQIVTVGAGEMSPIDDNESHGGRALNRRVELKIVAQ